MEFQFHFQFLVPLDYYFLANDTMLDAGAVLRNEKADTCAFCIHSPHQKGLPYIIKDSLP